jgi:hypothetical protein
MADNTINQRLKILIEALGLSVNAFGEAIGVPGTTTRNYLVRGTNPKSDFLAKVARRFEQVNPIWLFTGEGDMLTDGAKNEGHTTQTGNFNQAGTSNKQTIKGNKGNIQTSTGNGNILNNFTLEDCKRDLETAQREIEHLRSRLQDKEELLKSKDDTIKLLRGTFDRPN